VEGTNLLLTHGKTVIKIDTALTPSSRGVTVIVAQDIKPNPALVLIRVNLIKEATTISSRRQIRLFISMLRTIQRA
jgi:hypothetical protein